MSDPIADQVERREVDTIWTVPNLVTLIRLLLLPVFVDSADFWSGVTGGAEGALAGVFAARALARA